MSYIKYKKFITVRDWWEEEGRGKFPVQVPATISELQKVKGLFFHEAFEKLVKNKVIVFVDE